MKPTMIPGYLCSRCRGGDWNLQYVHVKGDYEYERHMLDRDPTFGSTGFFCSPVRDRILEHALKGPLANRMQRFIPNDGDGWE